MNELYFLAGGIFGGLIACAVYEFFFIPAVIRKALKR